MWSQIVLVAGAFGLGYYFATRGQPGNAKKQTAPAADVETMAGTFPEGSATHVESDPQQKAAARKSSTGKKPSKKGSRPKKPSKKAAKTTDEAATPADDATKTTAAPRTLETKKPVVVAQPLAADQSRSASEPGSDEEPEPQPAVEEDVWETVGTEGYRPEKTASKHIPVHESAWGKLEPDKDLGKEPEAKPAARVLRIGAAAHPGPASSPRRTARSYEYEEALTKKQRQNMRKEERKRAEKAYVAELQAQRLRQHQRGLVEVRSREQWEKAKRKTANTPKPASAGTSKVNGKASVFEDKLIWD
ncbi:hypothetical protein DL89DRAFT_268374 [Linderina pennispora]|uniref:Uncharacterized protein n=1 Tax=Linderina pennispora TaxID=61395 RepID=A0A1Y1W4V3_9FUNG|nr:uncharacterized protein DL89DRAFT_268374 [Linderina pennispora]ORX68551.1 hypothetical protein DL89DRAFT_268374 [Linderina pennispora]